MYTRHGPRYNGNKTMTMGHMCSQDRGRPPNPPPRSHVSRSTDLGVVRIRFRAPCVPCICPTYHPMPHAVSRSIQKNILETEPPPFPLKLPRPAPSDRSDHFPPALPSFKRTYSLLLCANFITTALERKPGQVRSGQIGPFDVQRGEREAYYRSP